MYKKKRISYFCPFCILTYPKLIKIGGGQLVIFPCKLFFVHTTFNVNKLIL